MSKPVSSEDYEQIKQFLRAGISEATLCKRFNITLSTLHSIKQDIAGAVNHRGRKFTQYDIKKMLELYKAGFTAKEVAKMYGCSILYVYQLNRRAKNE